MAAQPKRLTKATRSDLLKRYRQRIEASKKMREKGEYDTLWKRLIDLYRGKHFESELLTEQDRIAVNICFSTINVIAPSVAVNHPKIVVWARQAEDDTKASILEAVINYWWRHFKVQSQVQLAVKDWLVLGHGWLKVGWRYVEEEKQVEEAEDQADSPDNESSGDSTTLDGVDMENHNSLAPDLDPGLNIDADVPDSNENMEVCEDRPFVERVSPFDIYVDPEATTLDDCKWIAQKLQKPLNEIKNDPKYRKQARKDLKPDAQLNPDWQTDIDRIADDIKRVTIWEFYDLRNGTMCVFPELGSEMLVDPIPQPYAFGHPFVMLRNYEVPDFFYPMGDIEALEPLQLELDKTRSQLMNHRKRYNRKYLYKEGAFDQRGANLLQTDQDNIMVPVIGNGRLEEAIVPLKQEALNPELYNYIEGIEADLDRISGVSEYERGAAPEIRRTATEASIVQDAANSRSSDKLAQLENVVSRVADRVVALAQQYMTQDQVARIIGKNGYPVWIPFTRDDIEGEYDFEVEAGSTQPKNDSMRRQQAMAMLQTFTPYAQNGLVNVQELLKYALTYGFDIKNPDRFLASPQQQQAQQAQEQQQPSPHERLIENMNYKDMPADIQRQMEQLAGFQPSQMGGSSIAEGHLAKMIPAQAQQQAQLQGDQQSQLMQILGQLQQQQTQHAHEKHTKGLEHGHDQQMQQQELLMQLLQAAQEHQHAQEQQVLGAAVTPQQGGAPGEGGEEAQPSQQAPPDPRLLQLLNQLHGQVGLAPAGGPQNG